MLEIEKSKNSFCYDVFTIDTDSGKFQISFENNLDLYWGFIPNKSMLECSDSYSFYITKENYFLYDTFLELYNAIKNKEPYNNYPYEIEDEFRNKRVKYGSNFYIDSLYKDGKIEWHSDDFPYDEGSILSIEKNGDDKFIITFNKSNNNHFLKTFYVRIRNSGSFYHPFNISFMNMYNKLKQYDSSYHQVHIEEYLYEKKVLKRKR